MRAASTATSDAGAQVYFSPRHDDDPVSNDGKTITQDRANGHNLLLSNLGFQ